MGVTASTSHANLVQCSFIDNTAPSGGGLSVQSGQATAVNCRFLGSQGGVGGGAFVVGGTTGFTNCVFSGNAVSGEMMALGGGLCVVGSGSATVTNCTLYGNASVAGDVALGGGVYVESATANVRNAIVWDNSTIWGSGETAQIYTWSPVSFSLSYSCVEGWTSGGLGGSYNTANDPLLADPDGADGIPGTADDDLRIGAGSSAIDGGFNGFIPEDLFDLDRNGDTDEALPWDLGRGRRLIDDPSIQNGRYGAPVHIYLPPVDMGAYEYLNPGDGLGDPEPPAAGAPAPEPSGTADIAFAYDALGRRIERIVDSGGANVEVTRYYWDGQNTVLEVDADEAPRRTYVHGSQYIDERVLMRLPNGQEYYYLPRELYSVAALTDETGSIVEAATYDTYGQVAVYDGSAQAVEQSPVGNPYYFTGRRLDLLPTAYSPQPVAKQLYHYRARAYDPLNGRFLHRDPLGAIMGPSLYQYVDSNPTLHVDPLGLWGKDIHSGLTKELAGRAGICCASAIAEFANWPDEGERDPPEAVKQAHKLLASAELLAAFGDTKGAARLRAEARRLLELARKHFPVSHDLVVHPGSKAAGAEMEQGLAACDFEAFAKGLHYFQDSWSHQGAPPYLGVGHSRGAEQVYGIIWLPVYYKGIKVGVRPSWGPKPGEYEPLSGMDAALSHSADDVKLWPADVRAMGMATYDKLLDFKKKCPCACPCPRGKPQGSLCKTSCGKEQESEQVYEYLDDKYKGPNISDSF